MKTENYDAFLLEELRDPELAAEYLTAAIEDGSTELFLIALRNVAEAHGGVSQIAGSGASESADHVPDPLERGQSNTLDAHDDPACRRPAFVLLAGDHRPTLSWLDAPGASVQAEATSSRNYEVASSEQREFTSHHGTDEC